MRDAKGRTIKCTKKVTPIGTPYSQTSLRSLSQDLAKMWPNLFGPNVGFWKREYEKHGICHFISSDKYLEEGMAIYAEVKRALMIQDPFSFFPEFSSSTGVVVGQRYTPVDLANTILQLSQSQLGRVIVRCRAVQGIGHVIREIEFCALSQGQVATQVSQPPASPPLPASPPQSPTPLASPPLTSPPCPPGIFVLPITVVHGVVGFFRSLGSFLPYYGGGEGEGEEEGRSLGSLEEEEERRRIGTETETVDGLVDLAKKLQVTISLNIQSPCTTCTVWFKAILDGFVIVA
ncbi:hypothetical protein Vadar_025067 [Vaccinium darrowii]|uniref:Uncharacterized protein n=1 Tax=Vaccinium darrowii TaxID=229202 RepID=A0ACB7ZLC4_9ERIC|nr:hypothetical protein Vadar_025067 [Vaccinium darrowii]